MVPYPQETSVPQSKKTLSNYLIPVISAGNHLLTSYPVRELRATVHNEHSDFKIPLVTLLKFRELRKNTERWPRLARQSSPTDSTSLCAPAVWPSAPVLDKKLKDDFRKSVTGISRIDWVISQCFLTSLVNNISRAISWYRWFSGPWYILH